MKMRNFLLPGAFLSAVCSFQPLSAAPRTPGPSLPELVRASPPERFDKSNHSVQRETQEVSSFPHPLNLAFHHLPSNAVAVRSPISATERVYRDERAAKTQAVWALQAQPATSYGGAGMLLMGGLSVDCMTNGPVYLTNVVCQYSTNEGWTVYFDIMGGTNETAYDIFATSELAGRDITNSVWTWLESGYTCETHYFTNQATNQMFYVLTVPGADRDGDGLYDGWEWKHFGTLAQTVEGDYDGDGVSNGGAFPKNDPNLISFGLDFGANYVNGNAVAASITVWQGVPERMAVLVNDTNFEAAVWRPYQSNFVVAIETVDGRYTIWVGLRGHSSASAQTWHAVTITRDTVPPEVFITQPGGGVTSQPVLQLQGYANEPLELVRYDLTNAVNWLTNQTGYVLKQWRDTNTLRFTTNWFQCYDLTLAANANELSLTVADLAGNETTTNLTLSLDFSGDTNAPEIELVWPEDNALVAGENFTLRGQLDDVTASVMVTLNANGYSGTVNRDGYFEVSELPLAGSTNIVLVVATDAAGNSRQANRIVRRSTESLTIDPVSPGQLTTGAVVLSGTVGTSGQSVWVNGIAALVSSNSWTVEVPVSSGNVAHFEVQTGDTLASSVAAKSLTVEAATSIQPVNYTEHFQIEAGNPYYRERLTRDQEWQLDRGGGSSQSSSGSPGSCTSGITWAGIWPTEQLFAGESSCNNSYDEYTYLPFQFDQRASRFVGTGALYTSNELSSTFQYFEVLQRQAQTTVRLEAGGEPTPGVNQLIRLTLAAAANSDPWAGFYNLYTPAGGNPAAYWEVNDFEYEGDVPLPATALRVMDQPVSATVTNANVGEVFMTMPAGGKRDLPVSAPGVDYYTYDVQAEEIKAAMLGDANRDGLINDLDRNSISAANPLRFWINDDDDSGDTGGDDIPDQGDVPSLDRQLPAGADYHTAVGGDYDGVGFVDGTRDLIDFFPVYLDITNLLTLLPPSDTVKYKLKQQNEAVNVLFTPLSVAQATDYQTDSAVAQDLLGRHTIKITSAGVTIPESYLTGMVHGTNAVMLVEGRAATANPLRLVVEKDGVPVVELALPLRIGGVELMFRHLNLRDGTDAPSNLPGLPYSGDIGFQSRMEEPPNNPDSLSNGRWLVFVHGYNVSAARSHGWEAEAFKRFYWSGSRARYVGVDWLGNPDGEDVLADYHYAVMNAFQSAAKLAEKLNPLAGSKTIVGHSLGCGVTAFALVDHGLQVNNACLVDAALASECFDGDNAEDIANMAYAPWTQTADPSTPNYPRELWAADWYKRFQGGSDARQLLTWNNRFINALPVIHNFYSSTEDVLGIWPGAPTTVVIENLIQGGGLGNFAWVMQEKTKGNKLQLLGALNLTGSDYGGWGFNFMDGYLSEYPKWYVPINGNRRVKTPTEIGTVTQTLLDGSRSNPLFKSGWGAFELNNPENESVVTDAQYYTGPSWIFALYQAGATGHTIASDPVKRVHFLAEAVPALSPPAGLQPLVKALGRNYNMPALYASALWPRGPKPGTDTPLWRHSDLREVAFLYNSTLFKAVVNISNQ
jgi:pimeloyl-ACP methyl ester carboxylesterase